MTNPEDREKKNVKGDSLPERSHEPSENDTPAGKIDPERYLGEHPTLASELKQLFSGITAFPIEKSRTNSESREEEEEINQVMGDFLLIRKIGSGGMARVFEAEQLSLKRLVAIKVLFSHLSLSDKALIKFQREAEAGARQQHPGIITIFGVGEHDGMHYIVEELVKDGRTLADELMQLKKEMGHTSAFFKEVARIFAHTADALDHAHASGVIHRDIKPTNILITPDHQPKVTDFGLARIEDAMILSRTGEYSGTPYYMSPEQASSKHKEIDHRSDIFSLGITLYEALTFKRPFNGQTSFEIINAVVDHEPRDPLKINSAIPRDLAVICSKALEKECDRRYASMQEFADDLRRFMAGEPILAKPAGMIRTTLKKLRRHRVISLFLIMACLTLIAFSLLVQNIYEDRQQEETGRAMRYQPTHHTLGWSDRPLETLKMTEEWLRSTAPESPDTSMLMAIRLLAQNRDNISKRKASLEEAVDHLKYAAGRYEEEMMPALADDCRYLLGVASLRLAQEQAIVPADQDLWRSQGEQALEGAADTADNNSFVWREDRERDLWFSALIRLNTQHRLAKLYRGVDLFNDLYRGGKRNTFDQASSYLKEVLEDQPRNRTALLCLGRLHYFWARAYQSYELLAPALELLEGRALPAFSPSPYYMIYVTIGQIRMLMGSYEEAEAAFVEALDHIRFDDGHIHNIHRNLGKIAAAKGEYDEALGHYRLAFEQRPRDPHINIALGEFYLHQGDLDTAMQYSQVAEERAVAGAFLLSARILMAQKAYGEAYMKLRKTSISDEVIPSARDRALACVLLSVLPLGVDGMPKNTDSIAFILAESARYLTGSSPPPICMSAMGVAEYLNANYTTAIQTLRRAWESRSLWDPGIRSAHWWEEACDLFFMARAYAARARTDQAQPDDQLQADAFQRSAMALFDEQFDPNMEMADLIRIIHDQSCSYLSRIKNEDPR